MLNQVNNIQVRRDLQLPFPVYKTEKLLGIGAQGKVYAAQMEERQAGFGQASNDPAQPTSTTRVALKVFNSDVDGLIKKALKEFDILKKVQDHPNFVRVLDF